MGSCCSTRESIDITKAIEVKTIQKDAVVEDYPIDDSFTTVEDYPVEDYGNHAVIEDHQDINNYNFIEDNGNHAVEDYPVEDNTTKVDNVRIVGDYPLELPPNNKEIYLVHGMKW